MKYILSFLLVVSAIGCSRREPAASQDSLLTTPMNSAPAPQPFVDTSTGLVIDSSVVRQQPDIERLKGIDPVRVVEIYRAFQPLRNHATTPAQRNAFLRQQKISSNELQAVLAEGDRLGWGNVH